MATISENSKVAVGLVISLILAGVSWGIIYQKVNSLEDRTARIEEKLDRFIETRITQK